MEDWTENIWAEEEAVVNKTRASDVAARAEKLATMQQVGAQASQEAAAGLGRIPLYPLALANGNGTPWYSKKVLGVPVWAAGGVAVAGLAGLGYWWWKKNQSVEKNDDGGEAVVSAPPSENRGGWQPSRTEVGDELRRYFTRRAMAERAKIYTDAMEAKKHLKQVSPLVTFKVSGGYKIDAELQKLSKKYGLAPVAHDDGSVGLYPGKSGQKAKAWEEYIDLLRDEDGQTV
jgi:hypothetical protein